MRLLRRPSSHVIDFSHYILFCPGHPLRVSTPLNSHSRFSFAFVWPRRRRRNCSHLPREAGSWLGPSVALTVCLQPDDLRPSCALVASSSSPSPHILTDLLVFRSLPITRMARSPLRAIDYSTSMPLSPTRNPFALTYRASSGPSITQGSSHHQPRLQST